MGMSELQYPVGAFEGLIFYDEVIRRYFGEIPESRKAEKLCEIIPEEVREDFLADFRTASEQFRARDLEDVRAFGEAIRWRTDE